MMSGNIKWLNNQQDSMQVTMKSHETQVFVLSPLTK